MAVPDKIKKVAGNMENNKYWKMRIKSLKPIGYDYAGGEARRYYSDGRGGYSYRVVSESEMHRYK